MGELSATRFSRATAWSLAAAGAVGLAFAYLPSSAAGKASPKLHGNNFFSNCRFSHASTDDPIVAAYWVPTLLKNGREVRPAKGQFYYVLRGYEDMHPFPPGLRMIAGDAHAHHPQPTIVTHWACGTSPFRIAGTASTSTAPIIRATWRTAAGIAARPRTRSQRPSRSRGPGLTT
jgi:hypothetical protein